MPISPIAPEVLEAAQAELRSQMPTSPLRVLNTENALTIGVGSTYFYRSTPFLALPVTFRLGAELQKLRLALVATSQLIEDSEFACDEYAELSQQVVDLIWKNSVPANPAQALKKKIRLARNPLSDATDGEVMELLSFFLRLRMMSSIRRSPLSVTH